MNFSPLMGIGVFAALAVSALGAGSLPARALKGRAPDGFCLAAAFGLGAGLLSAAFFVLCAARAFSLPAVGIVAAVGFALFVVGFRDIAGGFARVWRACFGCGALGAVCSAGCVLFAGMGFVMAIAPPTEIDALTYHMALPKLYAAAGGFVDTPSIVYSFFPLNVEMLYGAALAAGSPVAAALTHWAFGVFAAVALGALGARLYRGVPGVGQLAALLFLSTPMVVWELRSAYVDLAFCLYLLLSFSMIVAPVGEKGPGAAVRAAAAGLFAGLAVACKLTAGPCAAILLVFCVVMLGGGIKRRVAAAALFSACCVAPVAPWLVKTYLQTGNPVFPFAFGLLGGENWNPALHAEFIKWHMGYGAGRGIIDFVLLPFNLTFRAAGSFGWPAAMPDREAGWLFFFMLPVFFYPGRALRLRAELVVFTLVALAAWFLGTQQLRFMLAFWPALCLVYSVKMINAGGVGRMSAMLVVSGALIFIAGVVIVESGAVAGAARAVAGGAAARTEYIESKVSAYPALRALDEAAAAEPGAAAGLALACCEFYSSTPAVWLNPMQQGVFDYRAYDDAAALLDDLRRHNVRFILINAVTFSRLYAKVDTDRKTGREYSDYFLRFFTLYHSLLNSPDARVIYADKQYSVFRIPK